VYKKILVPLDGSELAEVVFTYAKELAGRLDLDLVFLYVCSPKEEESRFMHRSYVEHAAEMVRSQAEEVQKKTSAKKKTKVLHARGELAVGRPAEEILRYAEKKDIDIILMATHGRSGVGRWVLGSVADKVLRASEVPVWLVRSGIPEEIVYDKWPRRTILVPLDGSELGEAVLPHVELLAKQRGAEIVDVILLMICEPPAMPAYYPPSAQFQTPGGTVNMEPKEYMRLATERCRRLSERYLARIEKRFRDAGINVRSEVIQGKAANEIIDYANKYPFNLVVMSTHARSGLGRWAYGSVAAKVLQGISRPLFLVRPR